METRIIPKAVAVHKVVSVNEKHLKESIGIPEGYKLNGCGYDAEKRDAILQFTKDNTSPAEISEALKEDPETEIETA